MNKIFDALDLEKQGYKQLLNFFYEIKSEADAKRIPYRLDGSEWKDAIVKKWEMTHMLMEVPVKEGQKILDAGSQNSLFSVMLARLGCEVYPIDINPISMDGGLVLKRQFDLGSKFNPKIADMRSLLSNRSTVTLFFEAESKVPFSSQSLIWPCNVLILMELILI